MRFLVVLLVLALIGVGAYGFKAGWFSVDADKAKQDIGKGVQIAKEKFGSIKDAAGKKWDSFSKSAGDKLASMKGAAADKAKAAKEAVAAKYKQLNDKVAGVKGDQGTAAEHKEVENLSKEFDDLLKQSEADLEKAGKEPAEAPK